MRTPWPSVGRSLAALLLITLAGCSPSARKARHLAAADRYFSAGQYDQAEIEYLNVLQLEPAQAAAISGLGLLYFEQGRGSRALPFLIRGRELRSDNLDVRVKLGLAQFNTGRYAEARTEAAFVLKHRPRDEEALLLMVECARTPADVEEARRHLLDLVAAKPPPAAAWVALGVLEFRQQRLPEAEEAFITARDLAPRSSAIHAALAVFYQARNDPQAAEKAFASAAELAPPRSPRRLQYAQFKLQQGDLAAAQRILVQITESTPDYVPAWTWRAELAATGRDFPQCEALLEKVLARDRAQPDALLLRIRVKLAQGDLAAARKEAEAMVALYPQSAPVHYQRALVGVAAGDLETAAEALRKAIGLAPDYVDAILLLAEIQERRGEFAAALPALKAMVQRRPDIVRARQLLADAFRGAGDAEGALHVFQDFAAAFPRNPQAHLLTGIAFERLRRKPEAVRAYAQALEVDPGYFPALEQLVALDVAEKQFTAARARVAARLAQAPKTAGLHLLAARICLARQDAAGAEAALNEAIALQPDLAAAYFLLARLYLASQQPARALANLQAVVERSPKDVTAMMLIAVIQDQQGDYPAARATYEKIVAMRPRFTPALNNLAFLYAERFNALDQAYELAQRARTLLPGEPHSTDTLGWILYKRGQYAWAAGLLEESVSKLPQDATIRFHLGMAHYMMGNEAGARTALEQALQLDPKFSGHEEARQRLAVINLPIGPTAREARAAVERLTTGRTDDPVAIARCGALHESTGALAEATAEYERALALNPSNVAMLLNLARVAARRGDNPGAMNWAKAARKLAPTDASVTQALGQLALVSGDYTWATSLLGEMARKEPGNPGLQETFAQAAYRAGHVTEAEAAIRLAVGAQTEFLRAPQARIFLEMLVLARDPPAAAAAAGRIDEVLRKDPDCAPALMAQALASEKRPDRREARRKYEELLRRFPDFAPAKRQLALMPDGDRSEDSRTLALALQARVAFPDDPELAKALGKMLYRQGDFRRAAALLQESAQVRKDDAELMYYLGMTQLRLKRPKEGRRSLQRALEFELPPSLAAEARQAVAELR